MVFDASGFPAVPKLTKRRSIMDATCSVVNFVSAPLKLTFTWRRPSDADVAKPVSPYDVYSSWVAPVRRTRSVTVLGMLVRC